MKFHYHYKIVGFYPRTDQHLDGWGYTVELDFQYAKILHSKPLKQEYQKRLNERGNEIQKAIFPGWDFGRRPTFNFWEDTCLLTNVTVEPGNACGLDMNHNHFSEVKRGSGHECSRVEYYPHNVDSAWQASAILACWTLWYDMIEALIT